MEKITVIVPVYNTERYLMRCIDSIRKQTYENLQIIIVNDGSTDGSSDICESLQRTDSRVKVIHQENAGLGNARNTGLSCSKGTFVTFIDSDDWISETHIENLYNAAIATNADIVLGAHTAVNANGRSIVYFGGVPENTYEQNQITTALILPLLGPSSDHKDEIQVNSSCCMNLYKMDVINRYSLKFLSERTVVAEDWFFNIDYLYRCEKATVINEVGYYYYENSSSISRRYDPTRFQRTQNAYSLMLEKLKTYFLIECASERLERTMLTKIRVALRQIVTSNLTNREKNEHINYILNHDFTKCIIRNYPIRNYDFRLFVFSLMMRLGMTKGVHLLIKIREIIRKIYV